MHARPRLQRPTTILVLALALALIASVFALVAAAPGYAADSLLSQGRPATSSSNEDSTLVPANAFDGNASTRWASVEAHDPEWIRVDLGQTATISRAKLTWEAAYGKSYKIQTSSDGSTWADAYSTTTGDGATDDLTLTGAGRYVRLYGTARGTAYGYSLYGMEVYGTLGGPTTPPTPTPTPTPPTGGPGVPFGSHTISDRGRDAAAERRPGHARPEGRRLLHQLEGRVRQAELRQRLVRDHLPRRRPPVRRRGPGLRHGHPRHDGRRRPGREDPSTAAEVRLAHPSVNNPTCRRRAGHLCSVNGSDSAITARAAAGRPAVGQHRHVQLQVAAASSRKATGDHDPAGTLSGT